MDSRIRVFFLFLIVAQAAHSVEEYLFRLYDVFAPARFISGLLSRDLAAGFAMANAALVLFGLWCYIARVRTGHQSAQTWVWVWVIIELCNGIGHSILALLRGTYFPGLATAFVLVGLSLYLAVRMLRLERQRDISSSK